MATIQTGIELNDGFSNVIYGIINSVNQAVAAMGDMSQSMNADVDTSSIEAARDEINQATMALDELNAAMQNQSVINTDIPVQEPLTDPVQPTVSPNNSRAPPDQPIVEPIEPVEVPVVWNTDGLDVFTGTGIERFQQEVQSANDMLNTLNTTQEHIQQTASGMDILPDAAVADINSMGQRLSAIQAMIQSIENNPMNLGTDQANTELEQLRAQLNQAIQEQNNLNQAMDNMDVSAANASYIRLSQTVSNTERYIRDNVDEQGGFNNAIQEGANQADNLMNTIKGAVAAYVSIKTVTSALDISDELTMTTARLNMMNDGLQSTQELTNMVYAAAQDARGSFSDMAAVVAKFGNNAKDAFSSSAEVVAFADLVQKQMTIAGASTTEASNAMLQLSQALGSGVLRGDELNSIFEQAPNLIQSIADYLQVPIGTIREMASEGELSADVVKAAIFAASDEINSKFEQMPMTWGQIWTSMQNTAMIAFQPVFQRLNDIANSEAFQTFVNGAIEAMGVLANIVLNIFDLIGMVGGFIAENWSLISPIIYGVIAALAVYGAYLAITKGLELASAAASGVMAVANGIKAAAIMMATGATWAATTAQLGLNGAMYACPLVWILILIIAVIAAIFAIVAAINKLTGSTISATGIIMGVITTAIAFVWNLFLGLLELVLGVINSFINPFIQIANFIGNVFTSPISSIIYLFQGMADSVLGTLQKIASAMDFIFGSNMADTISGWRSGLKEMADAAVAEYAPNENYQSIMDNLNLSVEDLGLKRWDYSNAWDSGYSFGENIESAISDFSLSDAFGSTDIPNPGDYTSQFNDINSNLEGISNDTGDISDSVSITSEDLKYLRDIAEQEAVNRFTTAEITIEQTNNNNISSDMDLDGIISGLTDAVNEAVDTMTEGVHM